MSKRFEYRGDLAVTPLPEILATVHRYRVPGVATLTREGRVRRLFLEEGLVVFAASNEREAGLEMYLLRQGSIDADVAAQAEARRVRDGLRLGQVLLQMGVLTPERLNEAIAGQVREIVRGCFGWERGEVIFDVGARRAGEFVRIELPIAEAILEGIRQAPDVRRLARRLGAASTVLEKTSGAGLTLFSTAERDFYEKVDGETPLSLLCAKGPAGPAENARLLYAFFCLGLLRRGRAKAPKKIQYRTKEL